MDRISQRCLLFFVSMLFVLRAYSELQVNVTKLEGAVQQGAVCLDGTPAAYFLDRGSGTGMNNWVIKLGGGGWCQNVTDCVGRAQYYLGSSTHMNQTARFAGILNNLEEFNPVFYNWNRVRIHCCDGSSFTSDIEEVDPTTKLHHRGARIIPAVIKELLAKGLGNAENVILAGCSAGGLAVFHHCDRVASLLPNSTKVKCLADAGFFINAKDISGAPTFEGYFNNVTVVHGSTKNLPASCTSKMKPSLCFFPQYFAQDIKTPIFVLNTALDGFQVRNALVPDKVDPAKAWSNCTSDLTMCTDTQIQRVQEFRTEFLNVLDGIGNPTSRGTFINSCYVHCQSEEDGDWFGRNTTPMLNNKTIAESVADWFFERSPVHEISGPWPGEKTSCRHH